MAVFSDPYNALSNFQQALDVFRASSWLDAGPSGGEGLPADERVPQIPKASRLNTATKSLALYLPRAESEKPKSIKVA